MNPLSSLRQILPGMPELSVPNIQETIPASELTKLANSDKTPSLTSAVSPSSESFASTLDNLIGEVNKKQNAAAEAVQSLQSGQEGSLHQTMIALEEASISFQLMVEMRNKVLESYQELMRMQI